MLNNDTGMNVYMIGEPAIIKSELQRYLNDRGLTWEAPDTEADMDLLPEFYGRMCYNSFEGTSNPNIGKMRTGNDKYLQNIIKVGHGSVMEHGMFNFIFTGISRVFTHELVRHRVGVAISQESMRYVRLNGDCEAIRDQWIPPEFQGNSDMAFEWKKAHAKILDAFAVFANRCDESLEKEKKSFAFKKLVTSAMRRLCPIGVRTNIGWSANPRTLRFVLNQRTDPSAEIEMRIVFNMIWDLVKDYNCMQGCEVIEQPDGFSWIKGGKI